MAATLIQSKVTTQTATNPVATLTGNVVNGNLIVMAFSTSGASTGVGGLPTVTVAGSSQVVTLIEGVAPVSGGADGLYVWSCVADRAGAFSATFPMSSASIGFEMISEWYGLLALDQHAQANQATPPATYSISTPSTLSQNVELVLGFFTPRTATTVTYGTGYTAIATANLTQSAIAGEYKNSTSNAVQSAALTSSPTSTKESAIIATFTLVPSAQFVQGTAQKVGASGNGSTNAITPTAGNLLIAEFSSSAGSPTACTDTQGNAWTLCRATTGGSGGVAIYACIAKASTSTSVSFTNPSGVTSCSLVEFSGIAATGFYQNTPSGQVTVGSAPTSPLTETGGGTTSGRCMYWSCFTTNGGTLTQTIPNGWSQAQPAGAQGSASAGNFAYKGGNFPGDTPAAIWTFTGGAPTAYTVDVLAFTEAVASSRVINQPKLQAVNRAATW